MAANEWAERNNALSSLFSSPALEAIQKQQQMNSIAKFLNPPMLESFHRQQNLIGSFNLYIGETSDLKRRFNMGYGLISPRNCYVGGQSTNCKMNKGLRCRTVLR